MSILNEVFIIDAKANSFLNSAEKSFDNFKLLILKHSVERPPHRLIYYYCCYYYVIYGVK